MDSTIHAAASEKAGIGGIDYRIHVQFGYVCPDRLYLLHNKKPPVSNM
jgi:O-acetyl-ADP-ribose deacetylase (regulator of RNase III)